ncbi:sulfurtransferase [Amnibacterium endophyticum]|uniref:Sulfurtransferase n=1 Tax=Amnibacterium endophyticum TaxID=2109337 RepID=A0ABW4LDM3_9MICO
MNDLIDAPALSARLGEPGLVVLDVRWRLDAPDGRPAHRAGHVPGAVYIDLDGELAGPPSPAEGRHPLPGIDALQDAARRWGVRAGSSVVVVDDLGGMSAARAWWLLRHAGLTDVRVLDGGMRAWRDAGLPLEQGDVEPERGDVELAYGAMPVIDADGAAAFEGVLLDARAGERYRGEVEPVDPRAGHVPGAISVPTAGNLGADGRFLPPEALRERFAAAGVQDGMPVAAYCGSGVTAAHEALALRIAGFGAAVYPGSWSQWSNDPARPVATGDAP